MLDAPRSRSAHGGRDSGPQMRRWERETDLHDGGEIVKGGRRCEDTSDAAVAPRSWKREDDVAEVLTVAPEGVRHLDRSSDWKRARKVE